MASILKGAPVVAAMNERNAALCEQLKTKGIVPTLAVVRVGAREDDLSYERGVMTRCGKVGVEVKQYLLPADAAQDDLLKVIAKYPGCWARPTEGGSYIFLQLPALKVTLDQFVKLCRAQAAVTVTPGTEFGPQFTDSVRLNFSQDHQAAVAAVERICQMAQRYHA